MRRRSASSPSRSSSRPAQRSHSPKKAPKSPPASTRASNKQGKPDGKGKGKDRRKGKPPGPGVPRWRTAPSKAESQALPPFPGLSTAHIHIPRTAHELASARAALLSAEVLGFDTETKPVFNKGQKDRGPHLVQLSTSTDAFLLQIHHCAGALSLAREIMAHPGIPKVGFGLESDVAALPPKLGVALVNIVDLDHHFLRMGFGKNMGVRAAIAAVFEQDFRKPKKVTTSNWALEVYTPAQIAYAANDAYTAVLLCAAMPEWEAAQAPREWWEAKNAEEERVRAEAKAKAEAEAEAKGGAGVGGVAAATTQKGRNALPPKPPVTSEYETSDPLMPAGDAPQVPAPRTHAPRRYQSRWQPQGGRTAQNHGSAQSHRTPQSHRAPRQVASSATQGDGAVHPVSIAHVEIEQRRH